MSLVGESKSLFRTGAWVVFRDGGSTMGTCRVFMAAPGVIRQCNLAVKKWSYPVLLYAKFGEPIGGHPASVLDRCTMMHRQLQ